MIQAIDSQNEDFIAVVEKAPKTDNAADGHITPPEDVLMAEVITPKPAPSSTYHRPASIIQAQEAVQTDSFEEKEEVVAEEVKEVEEKNETVIVNEPKTAEQYTFADDMGDFFEDEPAEQVRKRKASLVVSGITNTNSLQNNAQANLMKRPTLVAGPAKTGITETSTNTAYGIPVSAGLGVKFDLNDRWSLGVGVNYSYLSRKFYGTYTKAEDGVEISSTASDIKNSQHFIGIPVNAYCNILNNKYINLYAYAGGAVEKCVSDKYDVLSTNIVHTEKAKGVQLSANAGIGVEFILGQHIGLYVDPSIRYYFDNNQPKSIRTAQPLMLGFEMGFRVRL